MAYADEATKAFVTGQGAPDPSAFFTAHTLPVKCNESLREDYCRWFTTRERNCEGNVWTQRYGMAHLFHSLKDLYQGEIVITSEPAIKPYDQCFMYDSYNDMHGVLEVEQVTHIFSSETGLVTCIVPDLVQRNELASMALTDALGAYFMGSWFGHQKDAFNSGQVNSVELADMAWGARETFPPKQPDKSTSTPDLTSFRGVFPRPESPWLLSPRSLNPGFFTTKSKEWPI